jgi:exodeoxyribonuclease V gamma subunit
VDNLGRAGLTGAAGGIRQVELVLDACTLSAGVRLQADGRLVRMRHARIKPNDFLNIWLDHLVLGCASGAQAGPALLAGLDPGKGEKTRIWHFSRVDNPACVLANLIALYREGMRAPLAFMPKASFAYARALHDGSNEQQARAEAAKALMRGDYTSSELDDACFGRFFDECIVEAPDFDRCSRAVFGPLLEHCQKVG